MQGFVRTRFNIYNPACFAQPAAGKYGIARSVGSQPSVFSTNLSVLKNFTIAEKHQLQFRAEAYNVFNIRSSAPAAAVSPRPRLASPPAS